MSILKDLINEMAAGGATSAGAIAGFRGRIGSGNSKKQRKKEKIIRRNLQPVGNFYSAVILPESEQFDTPDVISRMASAERKANHQEHTKTFGLEDDNGNVVKVIVPNEEAKSFETALSQMLSDDEEIQQLEIAEVLYRLKDRFTIVDVVWPEIEEDQEEEAEDDTEENVDDLDVDADVDVDADLEGEEGDDEEMSPDEEDDQYDTMSLLSQVVDLLKSQSDAKTAEARAEEAEAEAKKAEAEREAAMAKVRQEEQILDMETYYKKKKEADKEAKQLAQLAKWKHDMTQDGEVSEAIDDNQPMMLDPDVVKNNPRIERALQRARGNINDPKVQELYRRAVRRNPQKRREALRINQLKDRMNTGRDTEPTL